MARHGRDEARRIRLEPRRRDRQPRPLRDFGRGLREELALSVGRDDDAGIDARIERPFDRHPYFGGFADTVPRGHRVTIGVVWGRGIAEVLADRLKALALPQTRAVVVL